VTKATGVVLAPFTRRSILEKLTLSGQITCQNRADISLVNNRKYPLVSVMPRWALAIITEVSVLAALLPALFQLTERGRIGNGFGPPIPP